MAPETMNPAAGDTASGARDASLGGGRADHNSGRSPDKCAMTFRLPPDGEPVSVDGREAQTLALLVTTGPRGFTSGEASPLGWARRTSAYVHKLRRLGLPIATVREKTPDGALVARYTLAAAVVVTALECRLIGEGTAKTK